jgi:ABC-type transport system substrate-binding protein
MMTFLNWGFLNEPASTLAEFFGCQKYEGERCSELPLNNITRYANPEVDRLMQQAAKEADTARQAKLYARAESLIVEEAPAIFAVYAVRNLVVQPYVRDLVASPLDSLFTGQHFLEKVYIARE